MENLALFLGWTFAADVAHHLSGLMIHFIGRESMFVRSFLVFSACMYGARMAVGLYCGIYALFFSEGIFAFMLVSVSAFLLVIDRFIWFPKIPGVWIEGAGTEATTEATADTTTGCHRCSRLFGCTC